MQHTIHAYAWVLQPAVHLIGHIPKHAQIPAYMPDIHGRRLRGNGGQSPKKS